MSPDICHQYVWRGKRQSGRVDALQAPVEGQRVQLAIGALGERGQDIALFGEVQPLTAGGADGVDRASHVADEQCTAQSRDLLAVIHVAGDDRDPSRMLELVARLGELQALATR